MKKILLSFLFIIFFSFTKNLGWSASAQTYVTIPDANFATYLQGMIGSAMNGNQMDTSSNTVKTLTTIYAPTLNITDLNGLQYFHSLKSLTCYGNSLTTLPHLPDSLTFIQCSQNQIANLPSLPNMLTELWCGNNKLTTLPNLPNTLKRIFADQNLLIDLPTLPNSLVVLSVGNNLITSLPPLPKSLKQLHCASNQLTELPILPDSLQLLECFNNKISCFNPFSNNITNIYIFNNSFSCLPNYITAMKNPTLLGQPLLSYPLCNIDNTNGCPISADAPTQIVIPNIFTPNGDNINDTFLIKGSNLKNFSCKIYDRWGGLIYQWTNINSGWNGNDKNNIASNDGTYYYLVTYIDNTGKTINKNDFFQLLR